MGGAVRKYGLGYNVQFDDSFNSVSIGVVGDSS